MIPMYTLLVTAVMMFPQNAADYLEHGPAHLIFSINRCYGTAGKTNGTVLFCVDPLTKWNVFAHVRRNRVTAVP